TVARIMENAASFQGIDISEEYRRVYADAEYIAPLIGYTGQISAEELESLSEADDSYDATDIVGKTGLESVLETTLQGDKGSEVLYVDNVGRTLEVESRVEPQAGSDVYLTIDLDLQKAAYQILEQYIAGIVWSKIIDAEEFDADAVESADQLLIPVYDVYYALFENNVLDVGHLKADDATENEKAVYNAFLIKASEIFATLKDQLLTNDPIPYKDLEEQYQIYESYIVNDMLMSDTGILNEDAIDKSDPVYEQWTEEESISLKEFLTYAISQNWIDVTKITDSSEYMDTEEVFTVLSDYIANYLYDDNNFCKQVYRYMLKEKRLNGENICMLLFDQGVLEMDTDTYNGLAAGSIDDCEFIRQKIYNLEIRPSQLALAPCSGSLVLTDPNSGETLACVTYPGYDNNRLANEMDSDYFTKLNMDKSSPFYSRATQEAIAPGSTFKIVTATAGYMEGVINIGEGINCTGKFNTPPFDEQPINCWNIYGHGVETLQTAIRDSCNYFFNSVAYRLSLVNGEYVDSVGIEKLTKYASMYGLDAKSGLEVPETMPSISTEDAARSAMGQSTHLFTTAGLARYVSTIANSGTCYDLTLVKYITDSSGSVLEENKATVHNTLDLPQELWDTIHAGMRGVVQNHSAFSAEVAPAFNGNTGLAVAGKTGTAQQSKDKPNHGLFIGYAPYDDPEIALAVRITNGYSSANAALVARDVISYYYKLQDKSELITGHASQPSESGTAFAD
ncbi:MAG: penicillin-binding transpeptidase domain-containing protein, partial [Lachnospiraceae bacterium]|nr:penicillin-binding transpeptidase domain-containing protein [Lachnospiraceae bacterium]